MALILPAGMIHDRIKANAFDGNPGFKRSDYFINYVAKPLRPAVIFDPGFRDKEGFTIKPVKISQKVVERPISRIVAFNEFAIVYPLIVNVIVGSHDIEIIRMAA